MQELLLKDNGWVLKNPDNKKFICNTCNKKLDIYAMNVFYCREKGIYFCPSCDKKHFCKSLEREHEHFNIIRVK